MSCFFFNDTATTEIYTLSLHDALPIWRGRKPQRRLRRIHRAAHDQHRSEEHTSELQSPCNLVCRLLLEKKNSIRDGAIAVVMGPKCMLKQTEWRRGRVPVSAACA